MDKKAVKTTTVTILPPAIVQYFDKKLLSKFDILEIYINKIPKLRGKMLKKYPINGKKLREFDRLVDLLRALYEWKKAKEAWSEKKENTIKEMPTLPVEACYNFRGEMGKVMGELISGAKDANCRPYSTI